MPWFLTTTTNGNTIDNATTTSFDISALGFPPLASASAWLPSCQVRHLLPQTSLSVEGVVHRYCHLHLYLAIGRHAIATGPLLSSLLRPIVLCRVVRSLAPWGMFGCFNCVLRRALLELYTDLNVMSVLLSELQSKICAPEERDRGTD